MTSAALARRKWRLSTNLCIALDAHQGAGRDYGREAQISARNFDTELISALNYLSIMDERSSPVHIRRHTVRAPN
jgi:hypothetical protein